MNWNVVEAKVTGNLEFMVRFEDGVSGKVRFLPTHLFGVFEPLKDPEVFKKISISHGAVTWPGSIDLAPDAMYEEIKKNGEWVLN